MKLAALLIFAVIIQDVESQKSALSKIRPITVQELKCRKIPEFVWVWQSTAGMCIFWSETKLNFSNAKKDCEARGGRLAVAKTVALYENLKVLNKIQFRDVWIGIDELKTKHVFVWHDGTVLEKKDYPNFFYKDQPAGQTLPNLCAAMWKWRQLLDDDLCYKSFYYACEKPELTLIKLN